MFEHAKEGHEVATNAIMELLIDAGRTKKWGLIDGIRGLTCCTASMMCAHLCPANADQRFPDVYKRLAKTIADIWREECKPLEDGVMQSTDATGKGCSDTRGNNK